MPHRYRSVVVSQRLLGVLLFGLLLVAVPCSAVAQDDSSNSEDGDDGPSSVSVGNLSSNFTFGGSGAYNYEGNARALMISGPNGSLLLDYASSLGPGQFDRDTRRTIGAEALFGGNAHLFRDLLRLPLSIYIPIRINLDYRYTQPRNPELSNLHRGAAGLGAGGGAQFQLPVGPDFIKDNLFVRGSAVLVPAIATSLGSSNEGSPRDVVEGDSQIETSRTRLRRTFDINLEALFAGLLGEDTGVMVGYTFRAYDRSQEKPSGVGDVIDAATLRGEYVQTNVQHMVRVGMSW